MEVIVSENQNNPISNSQKESDPTKEGRPACSCKKNKCSKFYCRCLSAGMYCTEFCSCQKCWNTSTKETQAMKACRKVVTSTDYSPQIGCGCRKGCTMFHCKCYKSSKGCTVDCVCEGCQNTHGTKFSRA